MIEKNKNYEIYRDKIFKQEAIKILSRKTKIFSALSEKILVIFFRS